MGKPTATVSVQDGLEVRLKEDEWTPWVPGGRSTDEMRAPIFRNSRYIVHVYPPRKQSPGFPRIIHLSIRHVSNLAITDFRDFQRIKNELVHPEAESIQIFPAESRLVDSCNQYHLFTFVPDDFDPRYPDSASWETAMIPIGYFYGRDVVSTPHSEGAQQRPLPSKGN